MANIKAVVEYDGTGYSGFQRQLRRPTIQAELESALSRLLGEQIRIVGASRTDAGVHALGQVINFHTTRRVPPERLPQAVNRLLPRQIVVRAAQQVAPDFHARRMARSKRYQYTILNRDEPSALVGRFAYQVGGALDVTAMRQAARHLVGEHDFAAFQAAGSASASSVRNLAALGVGRLGEVVAVVLEANGFLYQMARLIVGALLAVGRGEMTPTELRRVRERGQRPRTLRAAPAHGLCLVRVTY